MAARLQFILRFRDSPWDYSADNTKCCSYKGLSSGLRNSVKFVVEMLELLDIEAEWVEVVDSNSIDKEVARYKPTHVILEALWVPPTKIDELKPLHPHVTWCVRNHSETPFIANEGIAFEWVAGYLDRGVDVMCNSLRAQIDMQAFAIARGHSPRLVSYAPNYYPTHMPKTVKALSVSHGHFEDTIRIGCFGAVRPLKNQMMQAIAALRYAEAMGKKLEFHVNGSRVEQGGNPILKNLQALFALTPRAALIESPWLEHDSFLKYVTAMDVVTQVSFSETFNIVAADAVRCNVPIVTSNEVAWVGNYAHADPNDSVSILNRLLELHRTPKAARVAQQTRDLAVYTEQTKRIWWDRFGRGGHIPAI